MESRIASVYQQPVFYGYYQLRADILQTAMPGNFPALLFE
jgi:hypothetical protein